jgi:hypothetical protein
VTALTFLREEKDCPKNFTSRTVCLTPSFYISLLLISSIYGAVQSIRFSIFFQEVDQTIENLG